MINRKKEVTYTVDARERGEGLENGKTEKVIRGERER